VSALVIAHAGAGATWQALLSTVSIGLVLVLVLVLLDKVTLEQPGDLVLPVAAVAIVSSLAPVVSGALSDIVGYATPVGAVVLIGLVLSLIHI